MVQAEAQRARNAMVLARFVDRADGTRSAPGETAAELAAFRGEDGGG